MKRFAALALGVLLVGFAAAAPAPADNAKKLVGKWEITKSSGDAPEGTIVEFTDAGKVHVTVKLENQEIKIEGKYTVDKDKVTLELKANDKDVKEELTVKKLAEDDLELEDKEKKVDVLKRKK